MAIDNVLQVTSTATSPMRRSPQAIDDFLQTAELAHAATADKIMFAPSLAR